MQFLLPVLAVLLLLATLTTGQETDVIRRDMKLSDDFVVSWVADLKQGNVTFSVTAKTTGFVGFGLSPQGGMNQADVIIGGVDSSGKAYFTDRFAEGKREPTIDDSQDWTLLAASENATHTFLRFTRDLDTCDESQDLPINNDTTKFIWSLGETDDIKYHAKRGASSVNILDPLVTVVDTSKFHQFDITVNTQLPTVSTAYWCTVHKSPKLAQSRQIVGFRVKLDNELALTHNHHLILHQCKTNGNAQTEAELESFIGQAGGACYGSIGGFNASSSGAKAVNSVMKYCNTYMFVWAKGGDSMFLPEDVGIPISQNGEYFIMEIHYDNPTVVPNLKYETGLEVFTTAQLRKHEAAVLTVGHSINSATLVPPNTTDFVTVGHCSNKCTQQKLPQEGIKIVNVLLHAHLAGKKLKLRHYRNGTELPWISKDDNYDFNYQQNRPLVDQITILPGDQLTYECTYDSTYRNPPSAVIGGLTTRDEMCETFLLYYPKSADLDVCASSYPVNKLLPKFGIEAYGSGRDPIITKPASMAGLKYTDVLNTLVNWTDSFRAELQQAMRYEEHTESCVSIRSPENENEKETEAGKAEARLISYPGDLIEYVPPPSSCKLQSQVKV